MSNQLILGRKRPNPWYRKINVKHQDLDTSSAKVVSNADHLLFFPYFLNTRIPINVNRTIKVKPNCLALAYLEPDLEDITTTLCEVIFTQTELLSRDSVNEYAQKLECLDQEKRRAIFYLAYWLKDKNGKDPFSYDPKVAAADASLNHIPLEDAAKIFKGFLSFKQVVDQRDDIVDSEITGVDSLRENLSLTAKLREDINLFKENSISPELFYKTGSSLLSCEQFFALEMEPFGLINVQTSLDLLQQSTDNVMKAHYPRMDQNSRLNEMFYSDTFFGPVQFGNKEWDILERPKEIESQIKRRMSGLSAIIHSLFKMTCKKYCGDSNPFVKSSPFTSLKLDDKVAVLLVGVIRAAHWVNKQSSYPEHTIQNLIPSLDDQKNGFPCKADLIKAFEFIGMAWSKIDPQTPNKFAGFGIHSLLSEEGSNNEIHLDPNFIQNQLNKLIQNGSSNGGAISVVSEQMQLVNPLEASYANLTIDKIAEMVDSLEENEFQMLNQQLKLRKNILTNDFDIEEYLEELNGILDTNQNPTADLVSTTEQNFEGLSLSRNGKDSRFNSDLISMEDNQPSTSTATTPTSNAYPTSYQGIFLTKGPTVSTSLSTPIRNNENSSSISYPLPIGNKNTLPFTLEFQENGTHVNLIGVPFKIKTLNIALVEMKKEHKFPDVKAGRILRDHLFTPEERKAATKCGRKTTHLSESIGYLKKDGGLFQRSTALIQMVLILLDMLAKEEKSFGDVVGIEMGHKIIIVMDWIHPRIKEEFLSKVFTQVNPNRK